LEPFGSAIKPAKVQLLSLLAKANCIKLCLRGAKQSFSKFFLCFVEIKQRKSKDNMPC